MVNLGTYSFKKINHNYITSEEYFTDAYVEEEFESENFRTSNKLSFTILDSKYKKSDFNKVWNNNANI